MTLTRIRSLAAVALAMSVGLAHATSLAPMELDDLAAAAEVVAVGRCVEVRSAWNAEGTLIHTWATYEVERSVPERPARDRLTLRALGGTVGPITQAVVDGPRFVVGERDLLFLGDSDEPGVYRLLGLTQGKMPLVPHPRTGEDRVVLGPWIAPQGPAAGQAGPPLPGARVERVDAILKKVRASREPGR